MSMDGSSEFTRRGMLTILGAGALAAREALAASEEVLHFPGLDHVAMNVSDVQKSVSFYSQIFGNSVLKDSKTSRRYLKIGQALWQSPLRSTLTKSDASIIYVLVSKDIRLPKLRVIWNSGAFPFPAWRVD